VRIVCLGRGGRFEVEGQGRQGIAGEYLPEQCEWEYRQQRLCRHEEGGLPNQGGLGCRFAEGLSGVTLLLFGGFIVSMENPTHAPNLFFQPHHYFTKFYCW